MRRSTWLVAILLFLPGMTHAQGTSSEAEAPLPPDAWDIHPLRIFAGGAAGYGNVSGDQFSRAADGVQALVGADLAYEPTHYVIESGAGWFYSKLDGALASSAPISLRTRAGFFDASARYRLTQHWQIGAAYDLTFGADSSFGPGVGPTNATSLLGPRVVYEMGLGIFPFRLIGQTLAALGDGGRSFILATVGFQFGLPIPPTERPPAPPPEAPIHLSSAATVRIELDPHRVYFSTDSSEVRPEVRKVLRDIGDYLAQHEDVWGRLNVDGYADQRGTAPYNMKLSGRRAQSVVDELKNAGADPGKVDAEAYGFTHLADPHNNPQAWAKNRRVVLLFEGVTDSTRLSARIQELSRYEIKGGS